jgi:hypothetical protein
MRFRHLSWALALIAGVAARVHAQGNTATVNGTSVDQSNIAATSGLPETATHL